MCAGLGPGSFLPQLHFRHELHSRKNIPLSNSSPFASINTFRSDQRSDCYPSLQRLYFAMQNDTINQQFRKEYQSISDVYYASTEDDVLALKGCLVRARSLLEEPSIPRYYRLKTLLLLASMAPETSEA
jgi:hypothetical protein